jgi:hypothetical protein
LAEVPYSGVNQEAPQVSVPDDYQHIQTNPQQFGGGLAQGLEQLGAGATKAALFYGQAASDNATNDAFSKINNIMHGDPTKMVTGPDGTQIPDTGYLGLKGRAALDARPGAYQQMQDVIKNTRSSLTTPEQQLQFDNASRRYLTMAQGQMGEHSDQQANVWYNQVNKDSADLALGHIATNFDNPVMVQNGIHDLRDAYAKNAQLEGAQPGDPVFTAALQKADRDAVVAQANAMGVKNPAGALALVDKNKDTLGVLYDNVANSLRARADQQTGQEAGAAAIKDSTEAAAPGIAHTQTTQVLSGIETHYALPPGYLAKTMQIESGGRNLGPNQAGAAGYFQFVPSTARTMHVNPNDFSSSADGAARLAVENAQQLRLGLGRDPDGAELYLAHQQGGAGATKLINNPNVNAASLVGTKAIIQNGGTEGMTAGQFVQMWANKYNGTQGATHVSGSPGPQGTGVPNMAVQPTAGPGNDALSTSQLALLSGVGNAPAPPPSTSTDQAPPAQSAPSQAAPAATGPLSLKADAYQRIMEDPKLSIEARQHALQYVNQTLQSQQIAYEQDQRAKKEANDQAADQVVQKVQSGDFTGVMDDINHNPNINWETRIRLREIALKESVNNAQGMPASYGPGFSKILAGISAPADDPNKITDYPQLLKHAMDGDITLGGLDKAAQIMKDAQKSPDAEAVNTTRTNMLAYAKTKLSFQDDDPMRIGALKDPKGEDIFHSVFVPKFMASYDQWMKQGKDPWQFMTKENVDKMVEGMRPPAQMAADKVSAENADSPDVAAPGQAPQVQVPPAPANVNTKAWQQTMTTARPNAADGSPYPADKWAFAVNTLLSNPTPDNIQRFQKKFGPGGADANEILHGLQTPEGQEPPAVQILAEQDRQRAAMRRASIGHVR